MKIVDEKTIAELKKLVDALEAGASVPPESVAPSPLYISGLIERYPEAFTPEVQNFFKTGKSFKSVLAVLPDEEAPDRKCWPCHFFCATVPTGKERAGAIQLGAILDDLLDEDALLGYLAPPSSIELVHPDNAYMDLKPPKTMTKLAYKSAIFCFFFCRYSYDELKARYPEWEQLEGNVGKDLEV